MRKLKICVLSLIVILLACEVSYAGSFSFGGSKKKKEEPKQQAAGQTQKLAVKHAEQASRERKQLNQSDDLNKAGAELPTGQTGGGGGSAEPSAANGYRSNVPVNPNNQVIQNPNMSFIQNPNNQVIQNPNMSFARNPNNDVPRAPSAAVSVPRNPNARES